MLLSGCLSSQGRCGTTRARYATAGPKQNSRGRPNKTVPTKSVVILRRLHGARVMSHCNVCWEPLQGQANLAACGHVFCDAHAEQALDAGEGCPLCGGPLAHNSLKVVPVEPSDAALEVRARLAGCSAVLAALALATQRGSLPRLVHTDRAAGSVPRRHRPGGPQGGGVVDETNRCVAQGEPASVVLSTSRHSQ